MTETTAHKVKIWISPSKSIETKKGENLRLALKNHFSFLYNSPAQIIHCRGFGTCGTCALIIEGPISKPTRIEKWRLNFPPHSHSLENGLRLACQTRILGDIKIVKWQGLWGNKKNLLTGEAKNEE